MRTDFYRPKKWTTTPSRRAKLQRDRAERRYGVDPDKNERFTPGRTVGLGAQLADVARFDLDVAACPASHFAEAYYDKRSNGLEQLWFGRVWCNPPYDNCGAWVAKAWSECERSAIEVHEPPLEAVVMLLPATRPEQPWWQNEVEPFRDGRGARFGFELQVRFLPGRVTFGAPRQRKLGPSPFPLVFLIWKPSATVGARATSTPRAQAHEAPRVSSPFRLGLRSVLGPEAVAAGPRKGEHS